MRFSKLRRHSATRRSARALYSVLHGGDRVRRGLKGIALVDRFGSHGDGFVFDPDGVYTYESIYVGDNVDLGYSPILLATRSAIRIGSNVMFGPEVTIRGGNHRFDSPGIAMISVTDDVKLAEHDRGVIIENDVIGTRASILHGVTIGCGSVIGAGSCRYEVCVRVHHRGRCPSACHPQQIHRRTTAEHRCREDEIVGDAPRGVN